MIKSGKILKKNQISTVEGITIMMRYQAMKKKRLCMNRKWLIMQLNFK